jgi:hypothetical protein
MIFMSRITPHRALWSKALTVVLVPMLDSDLSDFIIFARKRLISVVTYYTFATDLFLK